MFLWLKDSITIKSDWCRDPRLKSIVDKCGGEMEGLGTICMKTADDKVSILFGVISGCVGGIFRDVTINETPLIFRKEIYALACLIGGAVYFLLTWLCVPNLIVKVSVAVLIIAIRMVSLKYGVNLRNISELIN